MAGCRPDGDSLLGEAVKQESASRCATAVEAKCECVEGVIEMLILDTTMERTEQPPREPRCDCRDARHDLVGLFEASADHRDTVGIACIRKSSVASPAIGLNGRARLDRLPDKLPQALRGAVLDSAHSDAPDSVTPFLGRHDDESLRLGLPASRTLFRATHSGLAISMSPVSRSRSGRTMALRSVCSQVQAVSSLPRPSTRCRPKALTPFFWLVMNHIASNHIRNGLQVSWHTVPAVSEVSALHAVHLSTPRAVTHGSSTAPHRRHTNTAGQRRRRT